MADGPDQEQKTEEPSAKRLDDARKKGQVAMASETRHAVMFGGALVIGGSLGITAGKLELILRRLFEGASDQTLDTNGARDLLWGLSGAVGGALAPIFAILIGAALLGGLIQGRPTLSWQRVRLKWSKLSPMSNIKRMFGLVEFLKTLAKFSVVLLAAVISLVPALNLLEQSLLQEPVAILKVVGALLWRLLIVMTIIVVAIALADNLYQRHAFRKRMRMTRQELKDEHKDTDGDPKIKARIRSIQMDRARHRMMAAVPTASVVITNPTHYAVALKYEHGQSNAPKVVAKGVDAVAARIREVARANGVAMVANPPLARTLHATVEVDREVPPQHYKAVAEVIGYVMRLNRQTEQRR